MKEKLKLYMVVKLDDTGEYRFVKYGTIENGYIHQDYHLILQTIANILKLYQIIHQITIIMLLTILELNFKS